MPPRKKKGALPWLQKYIYLMRPGFGIDIFDSLANAMAFNNKSAIPSIYYGNKYGTTG